MNNRTQALYCDWGTTNLRAYLVDGERVIDDYSSDQGLFAARQTGFETVLANVRKDMGIEVSVPVYLSGMVGSKHGWIEAPYAATPVSLKSMAQNFVDVADGVRLFGGVCHTQENGCRDVMRGEEVQVFGVLGQYPNATQVCLPGTHSKWVHTEAGKIVSLSSWITGDLFESLIQKSIFKEQVGSTEFIPASFDQGVDASGVAGPLLNSLFHLRSDYLFGKVEKESFHSYLSGFLIGSEINEVADSTAIVAPPQSR